MSCLLETVAPAVEGNTDVDNLVAIIAERLRRSVPARRVRLVGAAALSGG
jgi:hypothetical protein